SAVTSVSNFYLAGDYVQCFTDCATMDGANETARRAVNGILRDSKSTYPPCQIWNLHETAHLGLLRWIDQKRYFRGEPWQNQTPWVYGLMNVLFKLLAWIFNLKG
ncbi:MAG: phytoene dehydrogenase, partial [Bacteroidia bacterium]